jgi:PAS domain S-box-containing protein
VYEPWQKHFDVTCYPSVEGLSVFYQDVTAQNEREEKLLKMGVELVNFRNALNNSAIVSITDLRGKIIYANKRFLEITKYSATELIGQDHKKINSGHHPKGFWKSMYEGVSKGNSWRAEVKNKAKDGSYYWVDTIINPMHNQKGEIYQYMSVRYLITDWKDLEAQRGKLQKNLESYAFQTSHKLRGALARLLGLLNILKEGMAGNDPRELAMIHQMLLDSGGEVDEVIKKMNDALSQDATELMIDIRSHK